MKLTVEINIDEFELASLIISAFEGGSNYWYVIDKDKSVAPDNDKLWKFPKDSCLGDDGTVFWHVQWPMSEGGRLFVTNKFDDEGEEGYLDLASIKKGLTIMQEKYPRHFANFMSDNADANTGDVFLQCAVLGNLVYG
jgi:hypothetical protein